MKTTSSLIRIAVAGAGLIGREHIRVIIDNSDCCLSAIIDPSVTAKELANRYQIPYYPDLTALFSSKQKVDAVVLATPNALHHEHALQCVQAGVPILLEKPIAATVAEAEAIVQATEKTGVPVLIGHHRAHSPIMALAKQVISKGRLGDLVAVQGSALFFKPDDYFVAGPWRTQPGGGPIALNLIHEIHNLRMLCGEIIAVQAMTSHARRHFAVEDTAVINLHFANGALGSFVLSDTAASGKSWEQTAQENPAYASYEDENCYHIAGTFGALSVPSMRLKTWHQAEERSWYKPFQCDVLNLQRQDPLQLQMQHFVKVICGTVEPLVSARDGLQNLRVTEAIMQASATQRTITICQA